MAPSSLPVVVTGGSSGLGEAVARLAQERGLLPVVLDRQPPKWDVPDVHGDLADARAAERAVASVAERHGGLRAVVTAAGIDACGTLAEVPAADWERVIAVNLVGTVAVVRAALQWLELGRGAVVTVASTLGLRA